MNIDSLLKRYFANSNVAPTIEVFDEENIHRVYVDVVNTFKVRPEIWMIYGKT